MTFVYFEMQLVIVSGFNKDYIYLLFHLITRPAAVFIDYLG